MCQITVQAADSGSPQRVAYALVYCYVLRNFETPVWSQPSYSVTIPEIQAIGTSFLTVTANDRDSQVSRKVFRCNSGEG